MAQTYDIQVDQGVDDERIFVCIDGSGAPMDFTGCQARMQVRRPTLTSKPIDELTTENGRLVFEASRIRASFPSDITERYPPGRSLYDLEVISAGGRVYRLLRGDFNVYPEVTR